MLFLKTHPNYYKQLLKRKEIGSFLENHVIFPTSIINTNITHNLSPKDCEKRASLCTSYRQKSNRQKRDRRRNHRRKASLTVEAALAVPVFFIALICVIYLMEMMAVQMSVRIGMHSALDSIRNQASIQSYMSSSAIEEEIVEAIGRDKLDHSIIVGGSEGLDCSKSSISFLTGLIRLKVTYEVELPIPQFGFPGMSYQEEMVAKAWTGYESGVRIGEEEVYYIAENSSVYHTNRNCTHLKLDISSVNYTQIESARNVYGGTYSACSKCVEAGSSKLGAVYIARTGSCYHTSLSCSGLKRTIYEVSSSEIIGMGVCSRCGY